MKFTLLDKRNVNADMSRYKLGADTVIVPVDVLLLVGLVSS